MECAFILLVLCAFQTVFGDEQFRERLKELRDTSTTQMQGTVRLLHDQIEAAIMDGLLNGLGSGMALLCWTDYWKLHRYHENRSSTYHRCFWKALQDTNMQFAQVCFAENIRLLEKEAQKSRSRTRECIAKCYIRAGIVQHPAIPL